MLETILKLLSEQAFGSRPALERPITHLKYGILGAIATSLIAFMAVGTLAFSLYLWLIASGLIPSVALIVVSIMLMMAAILFWLFIHHLMKRAICRQQEETQKPTTDTKEVSDVLLTLLQDTAINFLNGFTEPQSGNVYRSNTKEEPASSPTNILRSQE